MSPRWKKVLRRTAIVLVVLGAVGLAGFTWFAFWPLEGSVDSIDALIPADVDFAYKLSLRDLRSRAFVKENLLDGALVPKVEELRRAFEEQTLPQIRELEGRINASIPLGVTTWSLEDDFFAGDTVLCGRFCEEWGPERGRPLWPKEMVVLQRVSYKTRFAAILKHGFVRERLGPGTRVDPEDDPGVYRIVLQGVPVSDPRTRSGCGGGFIIPPENVFYFTRVKDVLAFGNSKKLIGDVAQLGREGGSSFAERPDLRLEPPPGGVAAAMDLGRLHQYLIRVFETSSREARILGRFVTVRALERLNGTLEFPGPDAALAKADIRYDRSDLAPAVERVYSLPPEPVREEGLARLVPAADTFAVLFLRTPPDHVMRAIWEEALDAGSRQLVLDNMRRQGKYQTIDQFIEELATKVGETSAVAIARLSEVYDKVEYPKWWNDPESNPDPQPAAALWVHLRQAVTAQEVDDFLAERFVALGFKQGVTRKTYKDIPYGLLEIEQKSADFSQTRPAYLLAQDHLVLSTNEDYLKKIIDTLHGGPSLAADATFQATMANLEERANVALFVDLSKMFRVPPSTEPGAQPRGWLWDKRNLWVIESRDDREEAQRFRNQLMEQFWRNRQVPTTQQKEQMARDEEAHMEAWTARYPEFLEERRKELLQYARLRSAGLTLTAANDVLAGRFVVLLQPREQP